MSRTQSPIVVFPFPNRVVPWALAVLLLAPVAARSQVARYTVGPTGADFTTIQAAVNTCASAVFSDVDVQALYTYTESLTIPSTFTAGSITITGGWNSTFTERDGDPSLTTIDGGGVGRVVDVKISGGSFTLDGFTIANGAADNGAGIRVLPTGASDPTVKLMNLLIQNNDASSINWSFGGGVWAQLDGAERLEVKRCDISDNTATVTSGTEAAAGAGILISAAGTATFLVEYSWVEDNVASSDTGRKDGAGQFFSLIEDATGEVFDLRVSRNTAAGSDTAVHGSGGFLRLTGNAQLVVRRSTWVMNSDVTGGLGDQLKLWCENDSSILLTDSAVALGDENGLYGFAADTTQINLVNLTVVDHTLAGIRLFKSVNSTVTLYNSISYGNGADANLEAGVSASYNLISVDPVFVNPGLPYLNYHLDHGSPGLDTGNNSPPGGLGPTDLDVLPRIENGTVDIGCYEGAGMLFYNGFESGGTGEWSTTVS